MITQLEDMKLNDNRSSLDMLIVVILLDYEYCFMGRLYVMDSGLWTQALTMVVYTGILLIIVEILNQLHN